MLRLPLLNLSSRETNRLPVEEANKKVGCGGVYKCPPLPLELKSVPQIPDGKFVVYYGSDYYGELPPHHHEPRLSSKPTILLVRVDGCKEHVVDEGVVQESSLTVRDINTKHPWVYMNVQCKTLGRYAFHCSGVGLV